MDQSISALINALVSDEWRQQVGFSPEVQACNNLVLDSGKSDGEIAASLRTWLIKCQPCLFGRIAAGAADLLSICILTERDLAGSDQSICEKIQRYRKDWKRQGYLGRKSAFIVAAFSPRIANAKPDGSLMNLAIRLCELYLLKEDIRPDEILFDRISLETTTKPRQYREWDTGVNFFSAQGDKRWWHDHRVPGGIVFSVNSVGHMVKSGSRHNLTVRFEVAGKVPLSVRGKFKIDTLGSALVYAMKTIANSQHTVSGKATCLLDMPAQKRPTDFRVVVRKLI
jgi:hypothetical protein